MAEALLQSGKPDRAIEELKSYLESAQNDLEALPSSTCIRDEAAL